MKFIDKLPKVTRREALLEINRLLSNPEELQKVCETNPILDLALLGFIRGAGDDDTQLSEHLNIAELCDEIQHVKQDAMIRKAKGQMI